MEARLQKWGNSLGIRIPKTLLNSLNLKEDDILDLDIEENKIIIMKQEHGRIDLAKRFKDYYGENLAKDFSWDEKRGKEIW